MGLFHINMVSSPLLYPPFIVFVHHLLRWFYNHDSCKQSCIIESSLLSEKNKSICIIHPKILDLRNHPSSPWHVNPWLHHRNALMTMDVQAGRQRQNKSSSLLAVRGFPVSLYMIQTPTFSRLNRVIISITKQHLSKI